MLILKPIIDIIVFRYFLFEASRKLAMYQSLDKTIVNDTRNEKKSAFNFRLYCLRV